MRKLSLIIGASVLMAACAFGGIEGYTLFSQTGLATGSTTVVTGTQWITGKPIAFKVENATGTGSTGSVTVATQAGYGSSVAGAQTLWTKTVTADVATNLAATTYLWKDRVNCTVVATGTNTTIGFKVLMLVDDEP
jgi:hypothetical protein